ncbi:hypothetical protein [Kitasatospora sp. CB01950]|uniref:hypothetical protein n=1 Tax=Kitasatospora sp. CB01950 TaxID=1703930 RepID=UPI000A9A98B8|nr:hypothetical protein [Kitasatospora sp. CB01950]
MRQAVRRAAQGAAVLAAVAAVSGCAVQSDAVAGISVTEDGRPLGVLLVCGHRIDGATLSTSEGSHEETIGNWTAHAALGPGLSTWTLDAPAEGWETGRSATPLDAGTTYHLRGWTKDNSRSSTATAFTPEDLKQLTPGTVRYDGTASDGSGTTRTVPVEEFRATACAKR